MVSIKGFFFFFLLISMLTPLALSLIRFVLRALVIRGKGEAKVVIKMETSR